MLKLHRNKEIVPYRVIVVSLFLFMVILNIILYFSFKISFDRQNHLLLSSYHLSLKEVIGRDLLMIETLKLNGKNIVLLQNSKMDVIKNLNNINPLQGSKILYYQKNSDYILIDIQKLQEIIDEIIPPYLEYTYFFNKSDTSHNNEVNKGYGVGGEFKINLTLKDQSVLIQKNREILYKAVLISIVISFLFFLVVCYIMLKWKERYKSLILDKTKAMWFIRRKFDSLVNANAHRKIIENIFINKISENYIEDELRASKYKDEVIKKQILKTSSNKNYLFPLVLKGSSRSTVGVQEFVSLIEKSTGSFMYESKIVIKNSLQYIDIEFDKEVLYQVVFSIIVNLMMFLEGQSDKIKKINIEILKNKITFDYEGYPLPREAMIQLSNKMPNLRGEIFLLTASKLFYSMDFHNMHYKCNSEGFKNKIELFLSKKEDKYENDKIIKFADIKQQYLKMK